MRGVVLAPGPVTYKFVTDDVWRHSPRDTVCVDEDSSKINNQKVVAINATITWHSNGTEENVFVSGSFLAWSEIVPLTHNAAGDFSVHCCLPVCQPPCCSAMHTSNLACAAFRSNFVGHINMAA